VGWKRTNKSIPKRHKTYTLEQETAIFERLEEVDKHLSLFINVFLYKIKNGVLLVF